MKKSINKSSNSVYTLVLGQDFVAQYQTLPWLAGFILDLDGVQYIRFLHVFLAAYYY